MASVPSNQLSDAYGRLDLYERDEVSFGRAWRLSQLTRRDDFDRGAVPMVQLEHYGTVVLRTGGGRPAYVRVTSASDRDGVNGLLRLMGVGARWRVHRNGELAILKDYVTGRTWEVSAGAEITEGE